MSFKPTNEQLIDFVYGNLSETERLQIEHAMVKDASIKEQVNAINESRSFLHNIEEQEVLEPEQFIWELTKSQKTQSVIWPITAIAASLTLLLIVAYATQFRISYGSFELAFGKKVQAEIPQNLTSVQVQEMINHSIESNNVSMVTQIEEVKSGFETQLAANNKLQLKDMKRIALDMKELPKEQVQVYLAQLSESNRVMINNFFAATAVEQKEYMNTILANFFEYVDTQRKDDYYVLQNNIKELEYKNVLKTKETDQILSSILTTVNGGSL